ncbi:PadR family transcriptional regulator [Bacillus thuringiensis serovar navarrensis]|uniref:PadR family transcriptional regulator n=1 Tax=Bacillus thuringiensis serovar navarrensis TaxID=339658 RepID=A0A243ABD2_BACTU|nr:PadR family transcriptional regulator [Bacillus thuringiensis serovar navarrensis]
MSKRRYNEKIADISVETVDIIEESLIYFGKYQLEYARGIANKKLEEYLPA